MYTTCCGNMFTAIRASKKTRELSDRLVIELKEEVRRKLSCDEALRALLERILKTKRLKLRFSIETVEEFQEIFKS